MAKMSLERLGTTVLYRLVGVDETSPAFRKASASAAGYEKSMRKVAKASKYLVAASVGVGIVSAKMATDFQASMTKIQTQAGGSAKDVRMLSKEVLKLGTYAEQSPKQLADSLFHLKSVGLDNAKAMRALKISSDLAAVGQADLESTTNALAGAWRSGIKGAQNFHQAAATVNAIIGAGNMKMEDLTAALSTGVLPAAKTFGVTFKQVGAALALMTDEGVPANAAATRLRMTFNLLAAPTQKAQGELQKIGLSGSALGKAMRGPGGLITAIGMLKTHLDNSGMSAVESAQLLSRAFGGGRSSAAIMGLVNNFDVLKKKYKQINDSTGRFDSAVKAQRRTFAAQWALMKSSVEVLAIRIGNVLLPAITRFAKYMNNSVFPFVMRNREALFKLGIAVASTATAFMLFTKVALAIKAVKVALAEAKGAQIALNIAMDDNVIGVVILALSALAIGLVVAYKKSKMFRDVVNSVGAALRFFVNNTTGKVILGIAAGIGVLTAAWWALNVAVEANPIVALITAIVAAVALLAVGIYQLIKHIRTVLNAFRSAFMWIEKNVPDWAKLFIPFVGAAALVAKHWRGLRDIFVAVGNGIMVAVHATTRSFSKAWNSTADSVSVAFRKITAVAKTVGGGVAVAFHKVAAVSKSVWGVVAATARVAFKVLKVIGQLIWAIIALPFFVAYLGIRKASRALWGWIGPYVRGALRGLRSGVSSAMSGIVRVWRTSWNMVAAVAKNVWRGIAAFFRASWNAFTTLVRRVWRGWVNIAHAVWGTLGGPVKAVWNKIASFFRAAWRAFESFLRAEWRGWVRIAHAAWNTLGGPVRAAWNGLSRFFHGAWNSFGRFVQSEWRGWVRIATAVWRTMSGPMRTTWNAISSWFHKSWSAFGRWSKSMWKGIVKGILSAFSAVGRGLSSAWGHIKSIFTRSLNAIIGVINAFIRFIDKIPFVNIGQIPKLASGGTVAAPGGSRFAYAIGGFAKGGKAAPGGLAWVGERGAELMQALPGGGVQVYSHKQSKEIAAQMGMQVPGYSIGGFFGSIGHGVSSLAGKVWGSVRQLGGLAVKGIMKGAEKAAFGLIGGVPGGKFFTNIAHGVLNKVVNAIENYVAGKGKAKASGAISDTGARSGNALVAQNYARRLLASYGWGQGQMGSLIALWNGESGWNAYAVNPSSGAAGIPQALGHGHVFNLGDYKAQIQWGLNYIKSAYGSPSAALSAWLSRSPHWYAGGTKGAKRGWAVVGEQGPELAYMRGGETVLNNRDSMKAMRGYASGTTSLAKLRKDAADYVHSLFSNIPFQRPSTGPHYQNVGLPFQISQQLAKILKQIHKKFSGSKANFLADYVKAAAHKAIARERGRVNKLGNQIVHNLVNSLGKKASLTRIGNVFDKIRQRINQNFVGVQHDNLIKYVDGVNKRLSDLAKKRNKITQEIRTANSNIASKIAAARSMINDTASSAKSIADITQLGTATPEATLYSLKQKAHQLSVFNFDLRKLAKMGLNRTMLAQFIAAGPSSETNAMLNQLVRQPKSFIGKLNAQQSKINQTSKSIGTAAADIQLGGTIRKNYIQTLKAAQKADIAHLKRQQTIVENTMIKVGRQLAKGFAQRFHLKGFARGGRIPSGGIGLVGERGAELALGPSTIIPHNQTRRMLSGGSPTADEIGEAVARYMADVDWQFKVDENGMGRLIQKYNRNARLRTKSTKAA